MSDKQKINIHFLANPGRFHRVAGRALPYIAFAAVMSLLAGLWFGLFDSPADYQQGETVRIMYVHVPAAWLSLLVYSVMAASSASYLIWKHPLADIIARASAPIGAVFCFITLVTGALWGKPMWGAWWVWDARLTSMLILMFLYVGYITLAGSFDNEERGKKVAAVLALVGFLNIPVIKFSVDWWSTLHQPASILRDGGPALDSSMLLPVLLMIAAFKLMYAALLIMRANTMIMQHKIRRLQRVGS